MSYLQTELISHARKVRSLYKQAIRTLQARYQHKDPRKGPLIFRYYAVLMRDRFDQHKDEKDFMKSKLLIQEGYKELLANKHPYPIKFPESPGGPAYDRLPPVPDAVLDLWHPSEKALYPDYFARRDIRKREFIERWHKKYGRPDLDN